MEITKNYLLDTNMLVLAMLSTDKDFQHLKDIFIDFVWIEA